MHLHIHKLLYPSLTWCGIWQLLNNTLQHYTTPQEKQQRIRSNLIKTAREMQVGRMQLPKLAYGQDTRSSISIWAKGVMGSFLSESDHVPEFYILSQKAPFQVCHNAILGQWFGTGSQRSVPVDFSTPLPKPLKTFLRSSSQIPGLILDSL